MLLFSQSTHEACTLPAGAMGCAGCGDHCAGRQAPAVALLLGRAALPACSSCCRCRHCRCCHCCRRLCCSCRCSDAVPACCSACSPSLKINSVRVFGSQPTPKIVIFQSTFLAPLQMTSVRAALRRAASAPWAPGYLLVTTGGCCGRCGGEASGLPLQQKLGTGPLATSATAAASLTRRHC